ncbi:MAG: epimerase, partial [Bacteroidia bacterium]|nr:epimerase [Bacteroidia bacterium]
LMPRYVCKVKEIGRAMIEVSRKGYTKNVIEISDIKQLAAQQGR